VQAICLSSGRVFSCLLNWNNEERSLLPHTEIGIYTLLRHTSTAESLPHPTVALLVDRDDDTRAMYAEYLRLAHFDVEEATDGREALAKAVSDQPGVIVTETRLPGIDGLELCRLLRDDTLTSTIPILVVTGDAYAPDVARAREAGATEVLIKPCLPDVLMAEIRRLLDHSSEPRDRSAIAREKADDQLARSVRLIERSVGHRPTLARSHNRHRTVTPPTPPPQLVCPQCDGPLNYDHSHIGGVSVRHTEQWDYYSCQTGCGTFQYRQRTRKIRKVQ